MSTWYKMMFGTSQPPRPRITQQHIRELRRDIAVLTYRKEQLVAIGSNQKEIKELASTIKKYEQLLGVAVASSTRESVASTLDRTKRVIKALSTPESAANAMQSQRVREQISALGDVFSDDLSSDDEETENEDTTASGGTSLAMLLPKAPTHDPLPPVRSQVPLATMTEKPQPVSS